MLVDADGSEAERAQNGFDFLIGDVGAHDAEEFGASDLDFFCACLPG